MALSRPDTDFVTTTLNGAIDSDDTSASVGTGLDIPAANSYLLVDYDSTEAVGDADGPETIFYTAYNTDTGALTGVIRGQAGTTGVSHQNGASVQMGPSTAFLEGFVGARAYLSADQENLTSGNNTKILLDSESYDVGSNFASYKFVAPVNGYYLAIGQVSFKNTVADKLYVTDIYLNGASGTRAASHTGATAGAVDVVASDVIYLDADDYLELYAQSAAGVNTVDVTGDENRTFLAVTLLKEV